MGRIILWICVFWTSQITAQIINGDFHHWDTIAMFGQPYINPAGWVTNNNNYNAGLANTPVTRGVDSTGFYAIIVSREWGLDAVLPGRLKQTIRSQGLTRIEYYGKCDSLFQTGTCDVNVYAGESNHLVYTDRILNKDTAFLFRSIDILPEWIQGYDSVTVEFVANGRLDMWDEQEDGYAVFLMDHVSASYISSTNHLPQANQISLHPNPTSGQITLDQIPSTSSAIWITDLSGRILRTLSIGEDVDFEGLDPGMYVIRMEDRKGNVYVSKVIKSDR